MRRSTDKAVLRELDGWKKQLDAKVLQPVGRTLTFLDGLCRVKECNLGNLVSDSLVYYVSNPALPSAVLRSREWPEQAWPREGATT